LLLQEDARARISIPMLEAQKIFSRILRANRRRRQQ
jgi:hypothetical protein